MWKIFCLYISFLFHFAIGISHHDKLSAMYGENYPVNPSEAQLYIILEGWHALAMEHNIDYSLSWGAYLGYMRHKSLIPYDGDIDIHIGADDVKKLLDVPGVSTPKELGAHPLLSGIPRLIVNPYHQNQLDDPLKRSRFNCYGKHTNSQTDQCSFAGPVGRFVNHNKNFPWAFVDLFVYCDAQTGCDIKHGTHCHADRWCAYIPTEYGSPKLPETMPCQFGNVSTRCYKKETDLYLQAKYGKNVVEHPDKFWDKREKSWKAANVSNQ